jgi:hypothetical protein
MLKEYLDNMEISSSLWDKEIHGTLIKYRKELRFLNVIVFDALN